MQNKVSPAFGKDAKKMQALRRKDPDQSLAERWERLCGVVPDFEARYGFVPLIMENGWAVVAVPDDGVAYTVGLHYRFGQKELLIAAPHLPLQEQRRLLNQLGRRVRDGERIEPGKKVALDEGKVTLTFNTYQDETFSKYPCGYLARFEQFFEDRAHDAGGTVPVIWAVLRKPAKRPAKAAKPRVKAARAPTRGKRRKSRPT